MKENEIGSTAETRDLSGFSVWDRDDRKIGTVDQVWEDDSGQPAFLSVKTGWLGLGRRHFVPLHEAEINPSARAIRLPFDEETIKNSPDFESESDIDPERESDLYRYYRERRTGAQAEAGRDWRPGAPAAPAGEAVDRSGDAVAMELKEETLEVGKHTVEAGGVRLRKVIRTETVNRPVELAHEEIEIERVRPSGSGNPQDTDFREDDVFIPLRREVADVSKSARVTEEIRARKKAESERRDVSGEVRKEDIEVEREAGDRDRDPGRT